MGSGLLLVIGIGVFALALGTIGCYIASASENAENRRRDEMERQRMRREPWYADSHQRTPTS
jgi:hypothetical protein